MGDFKDTCGKWLTQAVFWELRHEKYTPSFSLKDYDLERDGVTYPSLKHIYLRYSDPTEYTFATEVLGGWEHWQAIQSSYALRPYIQKWREELEIKLRAEALKSLRKAASEGSKGIAAAKYLAEKGWEKKRGRPSKEEVEKETKVEAALRKEYAEDAKRLGVHH